MTDNRMPCCLSYMTEQAFPILIKPLVVRNFLGHELKVDTAP
jgi:hypothetical protein